MDDGPYRTTNLYGVFAWPQTRSRLEVHSRSRWPCCIGWPAYGYGRGVAGGEERGGARAMRSCISCRAMIGADSWQCPSCGAAPHEIDGVLDFLGDGDSDAAF